MCIQCWMSIYDMWLFLALWIKVYIVIWTWSLKWCLQWSLLRGIWAIVYLISYCQGQWLCWVITSKPQNLTSVHISWYVLGFIKGSRTCYIFSLNVVIPLIERQINAQIRTCKTCNFTICLTKVLMMLVQQVQIQTTIQHVIMWTEVNILNTLLIP